jgi:hypothetical protein
MDTDKQKILLSQGETKIISNYFSKIDKGASLIIEIQTCFILMKWNDFV